MILARSDQSQPTHRCQHPTHPFTPRVVLFDTPQIDNEMKSVPHNTAGLTAFYQIAVAEEAKRETMEAANKVVDTQTGNTALHLAAKSDDVASAKQLLLDGADPDKVNDDAMTALMVRLSIGRAEAAPDPARGLAHTIAHAHFSHHHLLCFSVGGKEGSRGSR